MRYTPDYYEPFHCTAGECPITCCQEWKISVDADTNRKWKKLPPPDGISELRKNVSAYTTHKDGDRVIELTSEHQCPFLNKGKLCRLVLAYGDSVLSETCTTFPREIHTYETHEEATLMPCCPAVIDLWFSRETLTFPVIPASEASPLFEIRTQLLHLLQHSTDSAEMALLSGFYILLELRRADTLTHERIRDYFSEETISQLRSLIHDVEFSWKDTLSECNELLLDLAVNYQKEALYLDYLTPILSLAETLSKQNVPDELLKSWKDFQNALAPYQPLLQNFLANEFFSDLLEPGSDLEDMILQMQWIALEYVIVRHSLFLKWMCDGSGELPYETVRDYLVIITRMTGYDAEDIREYMVNNFEELIWEWGYLGMIVNQSHLEPEIC